MAKRAVFKVQIDGVIKTDALDEKDACNKIAAYITRIPNELPEEVKLTPILEAEYDDLEEKEVKCLKD